VRVHKHITVWAVGLLAAVASVACATPASTSEPVPHEGNRSAPGAVYFLGVDQLPAGREGEHLAALYSATPADRWALTDTVRKISADLGAESIALDAPIDRWDPKTDPYNFGVISLRGLSSRTITWKGTNSRTHVRTVLSWLQIGHEQQTRMQRDKVPELRFAVSVYDTSEFNSAYPPTATQLEDFQREAFTAAVRRLLQLAKSRYTRELNRTATQMRYVVVTPPVVLDSAAREVASFMDGSDNSDSLSELRDSMGAYLEHALLEKLAADASYDSVVVLPNAQAVAYLQAEWSTFARRVRALSTYNLEALGFETPRLLEAVPLCSATADNQVHALEVRSNLTGVRLQVTPENQHVEWVTLTVSVAGDVKLPLDQRRSRQPLPAALPALQAHAMPKPMEKPLDIGGAQFLGRHTVQTALSLAVAPLATDLAARLQQILRETPPLSHPSYQRLCREEQNPG